MLRIFILFELFKEFMIRILSTYVLCVCEVLFCSGSAALGSHPYMVALLYIYICYVICVYNLHNWSKVDGAVFLYGILFSYQNVELLNNRKENGSMNRAFLRRQFLKMFRKKVYFIWLGCE